MNSGVMAEFATPEALVDAVKRLRARGLVRLDAFTPYPLPEVEAALVGSEPTTDTFALKQSQHDYYYSLAPDAIRDLVANTASAEEIAEYFDAAAPDEPLEPRYNVAPTLDVPVVVEGGAADGAPSRRIGPTNSAGSVETLAPSAEDGRRRIAEGKGRAHGLAV